jgi:hypothetical protein
MDAIAEQENSISKEESRQQNRAGPIEGKTSIKQTNGLKYI